MKRRIVALALACVLVTPGITFAAKDKAEEQAEVRKAAQSALDALYKVQPSARKAVESAAGYAAFSNFGMKIMVAGSGTGKGMAVNNKTKKQTYMKMAEIQAGLGFGVKKFKLIWVFATPGCAQQVRQLRMGDWWPGNCFGENRRQGRFVPGSRGDFAGRLPVPVER